MSLKDIVNENSLLWGDAVAQDYHAAATQDMQTHWERHIDPVLARHRINYRRVADFACGRGRNTAKLLERADHVTMIDVNPENIRYCRQRFAGSPKIQLVECSGFDLNAVRSRSLTFLYTYDSVVHFPVQIIEAYLPEFYRVLQPGGHAFIHHSNYSAGTREDDFRTNPGWRNHMSAALFAELAEKAGFKVASQTVIPWGMADLDCITVLQRPPLRWPWR